MVYRDKNTLMNEKRKRKAYIKKRNWIIKNIIIMIVSIMVCIGIIVSCTNHNRNAKENVTISDTLKGVSETEKYTETISTKSKKIQYKIKAPRDFTRKEIEKFLEKYSEADENIKYIYENIEDYDSELLDKVVNNPEMAEFVRNYYENDTNVSHKLTKKEKNAQHPLFNQWDKRWGHIAYGDSDIGLAGCGPTCLSMVIYSLTRNDKVTPDVVAKYSEENGYYVDGIGTAWLLMSAFPSEYNVNVSELSLSEDILKSELDRGNMIICGVGPGDFTRNGHFIVIYGYDNKGFKINDPNCIARSKKRWSYDRLSKQIRVIWSYSYGNNDFSQEVQ